MWRVTGDFKNTFGTMVSHVNQTLAVAAYGGPGGWNDPDMLGVGNRVGTTVFAPISTGTAASRARMTWSEQQAQFSLWVILAAPLIAGNDLTAMDARTQATLTNPDLLAVARDPLGTPGHLVSRKRGLYVIARPLADGSVAVVLFNASAAATRITTTALALGLPAAPSYLTRNLWAGTSTTTRGTISATVQPHSARIYRVSTG